MTENDEYIHSGIRKTAEWREKNDKKLYYESRSFGIIVVINTITVTLAPTMSDIVSA